MLKSISLPLNNISLFRGFVFLFFCILSLPLVRAADDSQAASSIAINEGTGSFTMESAVGGFGHEIEVFYHMPSNFHELSPVLLVIPGAGRNGDDYRDSWIDASEKYGVLILSPSYSERDFDFSRYHLGGIVKNLRIEGGLNASQSVYQLQDSDITFEINNNPEDWIFQDFDRIFETAKAAVGSVVEEYDLFGHSAGGQILHRFVLFHEDSHADRILAGNAGFYTQADLEEPAIFGLEGSLASEQTLKQAFQKNLVVFLGALDNENETRGTTLHTPTLDQHGIGRLARGNYFFAQAKAEALAMAARFNWSIEVVPDTGHDQRKMAKAAAIYLYD